MKKKGFTLIELLAVIVILAVIALITIPMIMNVIETSKQGAFKDSVLSAFKEVEYYVLENNLGDVPAEGIEVKNLNLKNNNFQYGIIRKDENGVLMAEQVSDGVYCAVGTINNLSVTKGECDTSVPTGEVVVDSKKATITLRDDQGVIGYEITKNEEASSWTTIDATKEIVIEYEASEPGTYYVHIKDKFGKTSKTSFVVENSAFCSASSVTMNRFSQGGNTSAGTYPGNTTTTVLSGIDMAKYKSITFNFSASGCQNYLWNTAYITVTCDGQTTNILSFSRTSNDANTQAQRTTTASGSKTISFTSTSGLGTCTVKVTGDGNVCGASASFSNAVLNCR